MQIVSFVSVSMIRSDFSGHSLRRNPGAPLGGNMPMTLARKERGLRSGQEIETEASGSSCFRLASPPCQIG